MDVLFHENKASMNALFHENKASIDPLFRGKTSIKRKKKIIFRKKSFEKIDRKKNNMKL